MSKTHRIVRTDSYSPCILAHAHIDTDETLREGTQHLILAHLGTRAFPLGLSLMMKQSCSDINREGVCVGIQVKLFERVKQVGR